MACWRPAERSVRSARLWGSARRPFSAGATSTAA
jgi:hypothetical protein